MAEYARVIVDISQEKLDKTFDYRIPERLKDEVIIGIQVYIPFGSRHITGYVVELTDAVDYDVEKIKDIADIVRESIPIESHLIALAGWMRQNYGGTMNHALKTVIPIREKRKSLEKKRVRLALHPVEAKNQLAEYERKKKHGAGEASCSADRTEGAGLERDHRKAGRHWQGDERHGGAGNFKGYSGDGIPQSGRALRAERLCADLK